MIKRNQRLIWKSVYWLCKTSFLKEKKNVGLEMAFWNGLLVVDHGDRQCWGRVFLGLAGVEHSLEVSWVVGERDLTQIEFEVWPPW